MTVDYRVLVQRRADLVADAEKLVREGRAAGAYPLVGASAVRYNAIVHDVARLAEQIKAEDERRDELIAGIEATPEDYARVNQPVPESLTSKARAAVGPRYSQMFGSAAAVGRGDFSSGYDLYRSIMERQTGRFQASVFGTSGDDGNAGYLIPPSWTQVLFDQALQQEVVRPRAAIFPMTTDQLAIAGITHSSGATGAFGVKPEWLGAGEQISNQRPKVRALSLVAWKLASLIVVPNELMADAQNLDRQLTTIMGDGLAFSFDESFLTGDGVGKPLGILNAACLVTVDAESGQTAGTIVAANLAHMLSRLPAKSLPRACWVASPSVMAQLLVVSIVSGAVEPILKQGTTPGTFSLMGLDFLVSEHLPELGTVGDILLCDFSQYAIGMRQELGVQFSNHLYFDYDETAFRALSRATGQPLWDAAYTPTSNGGLTLSPFVALATR